MLAGERIQPVRLAFLDGVAGDRAPGTQEFGLPVHLPVPAVWVVLADIHEDAHLRDCRKLGGAGFPHVPWESRNREEILRIECRDMKSRNASVGRPGDMKLVVLDFVVLENEL